MKKKLIILVVILFAVEIAVGLFDSKSTFKTIVNGALSSSTIVHLEPQKIDSTTAILVVNQLTGDTLQAWPTTMMVADDGGNKDDILSKQRSSSGSFVLMCVSFLAFLASLYPLIMGFVCVFRLCRNIYRSEVFSLRNVGLMRKLGWCLIVEALLAGQFFYFANSYFPDSFAMEGYTVLSGFNYVNVFDGVIYGIGMLILAEVFALGLRQKEELDLTV